MNLILNNLYRHIATGKYLRLLAVAGGYCIARTDDDQRSWRGPEAFFKQEFTEVDVAYAEKVGPSEHK